MPRLTREPLTLKSVNAAKPTGKLYRLRDATVPGLALRVNATGKRTWSVAWGRGQERIIGTYPVMTLDAARDSARRELVEVAEHGAPLATIKAAGAKRRPLSLREFVQGEYAEWARHELKRGDEAAARILSAFDKLADTLLSEIDRKAVESIITARRRRGVETATTNRDLAGIKAALAKAVEWAHLDAHPLASMKASKVTTGNVVRYLSADEEQRLRDALAERETERRSARVSANKWAKDRGGEGRPMWARDGFTDHLMPLVLVAMNTGLRRGELLGLDWRSVNLDAAMLTVTAITAKSSKTRHIPLNREASSVLKRWKAQGEGVGLVFAGDEGTQMGSVKKSWAGVTARAKLSDFRFHDLRHDFASKLVMAGVDLNTVRELLGHADIKMTLRYAHLAPDKLAEAVGRLR